MTSSETIVLTYKYLVLNKDLLVMVILDNIEINLLVISIVTIVMMDVLILLNVIDYYRINSRMKVAI